MLGFLPFPKGAEPRTRYHAVSQVDVIQSKASFVKYTCHIRRPVAHSLATELYDPSHHLSPYLTVVVRDGSEPCIKKSGRITRNVASSFFFTTPRGLAIYGCVFRCVCSHVIFSSPKFRGMDDAHPVLPVLKPLPPSPPCDWLYPRTSSNPHECGLLAFSWKRPIPFIHVDTLLIVKTGLVYTF